MTKPNQRPERIESAIQIIILLCIATMAGAASFTHVHDWTMRNSPTGTGDWFGWANAVISELTPLAAGLEIRRRKRHHRPVAYPMAVLIGAAILSLSAQVAEAKPGLTGWLLSAVPALAFLALSKLVLTRHTTTEQTGSSAPDTTPAVSANSNSPAEPATPELVTGEDIPEQLITSARMAAFAYQQHNGRPITPADLADYLGIRPALAEHLHAAIGDTTTPATTAHANGVPYTGTVA